MYRLRIAKNIMFFIYLFTYSLLLCFQVLPTATVLMVFKDNYDMLLVVVFVSF